MGRVIGIDLGTSNSAAAVMEGGRPAIIPSAEGAGVASGKVRVVEDRALALTEALALLPSGGRLIVLSGYTPLIELRNEMRRRGWTGRYWAV